MKETIQWRIHCSCPTTSGEKPVQLRRPGHRPSGLPSGSEKLYLPKCTWDKNVTRASQTRTSASKDTTTSRRAGPVQPGKKDNHPQYTSRADWTLASEPRAHSGSTDAILAAVQAGHHTLPSEGSGMMPPSSTPGATAGQCPPRSRPSYFTDEETESKRMVHACSWDMTA